MMKRASAEIRFVVCIKNDGYPVSLEVRKIYQVLPDDQAVGHQLIRVVDESGEDYLYPADYFAPVELSQIAIKTFAMTT